MVRLQLPPAPPAFATFAERVAKAAAPKHGSAEAGFHNLSGYGLAGHFLPGRLISRTPPFEGGHVGANPAPAANFGKLSFPLGGEIASRLAYTQKSEGQNLPERPTFAWLRPAGHLPRGVIRSASVSEIEDLACLAEASERRRKQNQARQPTQMQSE
jgi:hypothetical protein